MMVTLWIVEIISVMFLIQAQEFGGTVMMKINNISDLSEGVYIRDIQKKEKRKVMSSSKYILFVVYIRTSHLIVSRSVFFKISLTCPKYII